MSISEDLKSLQTEERDFSYFSNSKAAPAKTNESVNLKSVQNRVLNTHAEKHTHTHTCSSLRDNLPPPPRRLVN